MHSHVNLNSKSFEPLVKNMRICAYSLCEKLTLLIYFVTTGLEPSNMRLINERKDIYMAGDESICLIDVVVC